ncbi:MAG: glutamate--tRNA ligase [Chloroflexi bacterium RBG_13_51_18]|nr:MAG: glutamate--tRNA ligase [Chloroflexi bacterium RBG_13_51_18]
MTAPVRVRFAPSPTGRPQVGNIRTAMFDWLFARHTGGTFILRIEDTDVTRKVEGAVEYIMEGLKWLGLDWDEGPDVGGDYGPYYQSQRLDLYKQAAERLVEQGNAYYCYCSPERLEAMRKEQVARKQPPGYDRLCRNLSPQETAAKESAGIKPVVRFKVPTEGQTGFHDLIYGDVVFENSNIDDFVMLKSDGYPTYHLANVVDDHAMKISHVIRGEDWISSTPRHILMYRAFGYEPPQYIHNPLILGPDRSKLSKRHGAMSILEYRDDGYLPETMFNFIALIGWSLDDKTELMTRQQLVENFSLERMGKTGAIFNKEKLDWMNGVYIRSLTIDDLTQRALPFLDKGLPENIKRPLDVDYVRQVMPLIQERAKKLAEIPELTKFFFTEELNYDPALLIAKNMTAESTLKTLEVASQRIQPLSSFNEEVLEALLRPLAEELGIKAGQLFSPLRTAVSGETATPPLFEMMEVLGKGRCLKRIDEAVAKLKKLSS